MAILFTCPNCQAQMRLRDDLAGRKIRCKSCNSVVSVPRPGEEADEFADLVEEEAPPMRSMPPRQSQGIRGNQRRRGASRGGALSKAALWSTILGGFAMFCCGFFTGIPAVILGIVALMNIANNGLQGKGLAITGLTLGGLGSILFPIAVYQMDIPNKIKQKLSSATFTSADNSEARKNSLKQLGLALHNYESSYNVLPTGGVFNAQGVGQHGWQTLTMPFLEQSPVYNQLNFLIPWNEPQNIPLVKTSIPAFLMPGNTNTHTPEGYGASHYAGNSYVFGRNSKMQFRNFRDGTSNTVFAGEAAGNFKPWAHPENWRDPAVGIGKGPDSFGTAAGANFLLADGSVRLVSSKVSPEVLRAIATPAGGENIPGDDW